MSESVAAPVLKSNPSFLKRIVKTNGLGMSKAEKRIREAINAVQNNDIQIVRSSYGLQFDLGSKTWVPTSEKKVCVISALILTFDNKLPEKGVSFHKRGSELLEVPEEWIGDFIYGFDSGDYSLQRRKFYKQAQVPGVKLNVEMDLEERYKKNKLEKELKALRLFWLQTVGF